MSAGRDAAVLPPQPALLFEPRLRLRRAVGVLFVGLCILLSLVALLVLAVLLAQVFYQGGSLLSYDFLVSLPSTLEPLESGIKVALVGTLWVMVLTAAIAIPLGVGAAIYLEEYAPRNLITRFISLNIENLAGVPSIVYGILGVVLFVRWMRFDRSILSGALTLALLILPVIIIAAREAIAAVPNSIRQAAYALGATRWQTTSTHVLPAALPGIMTGVILSLSRAIGETAPLIMLGVPILVTQLPGELAVRSGAVHGPMDWLRESMLSVFTVIPLQVYNWIDQPDVEFQWLAAAGMIVLLGVLLSMNAVAVAIRVASARGGSR